MSSTDINILADQFNTLITQYQDTYQEFVKSISTENEGAEEWMLAPNVSYTGTTTIDATENSTEDQCLSACSGNEACSGATFDKMRGTCTLIGGEGTLVATTDQTAVVKRGLFYSTQLKILNQELMNLNRQMMESANSRMNYFSQEQGEKDPRVDILEKNYATLQDEEWKIQELVREYETLNSAYENGSLTLTSRYYSYLLYVFLMLIMVGLLIKVGSDMSQSGTQMGGMFRMGEIFQAGGGSRGTHAPLLYGALAVIIVFNAFIKVRGL